MSLTTGADRLKKTIQRRADRARRERPQPYDPDWGWWIQERIKRLETGQKWLISLAAATLAAEVIRIGLNTILLKP